MRINRVSELSWFFRVEVHDGRITRGQSTAARAYVISSSLLNTDPVALPFKDCGCLRLICCRVCCYCPPLHTEVVRINLCVVQPDQVLIVIMSPHVEQHRYSDLCPTKVVHSPQL